LAFLTKSEGSVVTGSLELFIAGIILSYSLMSVSNMYMKICDAVDAYCANIVEKRKKIVAFLTTSEGFSTYWEWH
jgi:hypothetical protein